MIFHNDPNAIRYSHNIFYKTMLLEKCNKIIFVSQWVKKNFLIILIYHTKIIQKLFITLLNH